MEEPPPRGGAQPKWLYLSPLALTLLPLLYNAPALKSRPRLRSRLFAAAVGLGLLHGATLILSSGARADLDGGEQPQLLQRRPAPARPPAPPAKTAPL